MKYNIIIPARYGSKRYKGKPLVKILGREMILRVADICSKVSGKKNLFIATDDNRILSVVKKNGYNAIMTKKNCLTGTDRVAEAAMKLDSNIFINVQGDEPTINPKDIKKIINAKKKFPNHIICGYDKINRYENPSNRNIPKVVVNASNDLIYISRSVIPGSKNINKKIDYHKQVCIYAFSKKELKDYSSLNKKTFLEKVEDIEILRFFDLNHKIKMVKLNSNSVAVDEISDVKKAEKILIKNEKKK